MEIFAYLMIAAIFLLGIVFVFSPHVFRHKWSSDSGWIKGALASTKALVLFTSLGIFLVSLATLAAAPLIFPHFPKISPPSLTEGVSGVFDLRYLSGVDCVVCIIFTCAMVFFRQFSKSRLRQIVIVLAIFVVVLLTVNSVVRVTYLRGSYDTQAHSQPIVLGHR